MASTCLLTPWEMRCDPVSIGQTLLSGLWLKENIKDPQNMKKKVPGEDVNLDLMNELSLVS